MFVAGLSFVTILEKEANIRKAFGNFDPNIIVNFDAEKIGELMVDSEIIRNLKKIEAVINNVFVFLKLQSIFGTFDKYICGFTNGQMIDHLLESGTDIKSTNKLSDNISKDMKNYRFKFCGSITILRIQIM